MEWEGGGVEDGLMKAGGWKTESVCVCVREREREKECERVQICV
jgi:hypothetical protein